MHRLKLSIQHSTTKCKNPSKHADSKQICNLFCIHAFPIPSESARYHTDAASFVNYMGKKKKIIYARWNQSITKIIHKYKNTWALSKPWAQGATSSTPDPQHYKWEAGNPSTSLMHSNSKVHSRSSRPLLRMLYLQRGHVALIRSHLMMHPEWKWCLQGRESSSVPSSYCARQMQHSCENKTNFRKRRWCIWDDGTLQAMFVINHIYARDSQWLALKCLDTGCAYGLAQWARKGSNVGKKGKKIIT